MPIQTKQGLKFWLRAESKQNEQRTPMTPKTCSELINSGCQIFVENSADRCYPIEDYQRAGCSVVEEGSWPTAPKDAYIVGIKELHHDCLPLEHSHIYFGHAYKGQDGWRELLSRFHQGKGELLDVEFMVDDEGVREVAEFGPMAGLCGCALGVALWCHQQLKPNEIFPSVEPYTSEKELVNHLKNQLNAVAQKRGIQTFFPKVLIIGSTGRCGRGATYILEQIGFPSECVTKWNRADTKTGGPFPAILNFDIFVNCIFLSKKIPPFLTKDMLETDNRNLTVVSDVSCDCTSPDNPLPFYKSVTTFVDPVCSVDLSSCTKPVDVLAIDHLPSLLPRDSSDKYADKLKQFLLKLPEADTYPVWKRCKDIFRQKMKEAVAGTFVRRHRTSTAREEMEDTSSSSCDEN